jgi:hypothetical protein
MKSIGFCRFNFDFWRTFCENVHLAPLKNEAVKARPNPSPSKLK